jgi:hypothetical protein
MGLGRLIIYVFCNTIFNMKAWNIESKFSNKKGSYVVKLPVLSFRDESAHIIYCPALDMNGSGNTELQAKDSFAIAVSEYLDYTTNKGTLFTDLKKLGWTVHKNKNKLASPPPMSELLENNEEFSRIFDNYPYKKFDTGVSLPAYA